MLSRIIHNFGGKYMELNESNWEKEVKEYKGVVIIDFWAEWCGPCKMFEPIFEELEKEMPNVKFGRLNVDENQSIAMMYGIMSIPTTSIFKDGEEIKRFIGVQPKQIIKEELEKAI